MPTPAYRRGHGTRLLDWLRGKITTCLQQATNAEVIFELFLRNWIPACAGMTAMCNTSAV